MKRTAAYSRYSNHAQQDITIDSQLEQIYKYAKQNESFIVTAFCSNCLTALISKPCESCVGF